MPLKTSSNATGQHGAMLSAAGLRMGRTQANKNVCTHSVLMTRVHTGRCVLCCKQCALQVPLILQVLPDVQPPGQLVQVPPRGMLRGMQKAATQEESQVLSNQGVSTWYLQLPHRVTVFKHAAMMFSRGNEAQHQSDAVVRNAVVSQTHCRCRWCRSWSACSRRGNARKRRPGPGSWGSTLH